MAKRRLELGMTDEEAARSVDRTSYGVEKRRARQERIPREPANRMMNQHQLCLRDQVSRLSTAQAICCLIRQHEDWGELVEMARKCSELESIGLWGMAEVLASVSRVYGESNVARMGLEIGKRPATCYKYLQVARTFPRDEDRDYGLCFEVHYVCSCTNDPKKWLGYARRFRWTSRMLKEKAGGDKPRELPPIADGFFYVICTIPEKDPLRANSDSHQMSTKGFKRSEPRLPGRN